MINIDNWSIVGGFAGFVYYNASNIDPVKCVAVYVKTTVSKKMSGHVGDLSPSQETALAAFRAAVADIPNKPEENDYFYLRWLRARKFDPNKALEMFRNVCVHVLANHFASGCLCMF